MFLTKEGDNMMITLENLRHDANGCIRCSNCKWVDHIYMKSARFARICPITQKHAFNLYSAPGLMYSALAVMDNKLLKNLNNAYHVLHLEGYYEGETKINTEFLIRGFYLLHYIEENKITNMKLTKF